MERRVLLAIFLAFLVLYTWQALFVKPVPKPVPGSAAATTSEPAAGAAAVNSSGSSNSPSQPVAPIVIAKPSAPLAPALVADSTERDIRVETRDVIAVFTNRGARLKSWRLKHYLDPEGQAQELVEHDLTTEPLPFTLRTADDQITATINSALYVASGEPASGETTRP